MLNRNPLLKLSFKCEFEGSYMINKGLHGALSHPIGLAVSHVGVFCNCSLNRRAG